MRLRSDIDRASKTPTLMLSHAVLSSLNNLRVGATRIDRRWQPSELRTMQQRDGEISQMVDQLKRSNIRPELASKWSENGIPRRYRQLWTQLEMVDRILPRNVEGARLLVVRTDTRNEILHLAHDNPSAGRLGFTRTFDHLQQWFYCPGMREDVQQWLLRCEKCGQRKTPSPISLERPCRASRSANQWNCGQWTL